MKDFACDSVRNVERKHFITKNGVHYWNGIEVHELCDMLDRNEIEIPNGFDKRYGTWHCNMIDIMNGDIHRLAGQKFVEKDDVEMFLDLSIGQYIP